MATYAVPTGNRFFMPDTDLAASSSDEEHVVDWDPYTMMKKVTADAEKKAKQQRKEATKKVTKTVQLNEVEEIPKTQQQPAKREPRGNQAPRRGRRNYDNKGERENATMDRQGNPNYTQNQSTKNDETKDVKEPKRPPRRPRNQDRKSGDPRTNVKAQEKRGGGGAGNWGKPEENYEEHLDKDQEATTPEETNDVERKNNAAQDGGEEGDEENQEPKEPTIPELSLEEYMASLQGEQMNATDRKIPMRQANDGEILSGKKLDKKVVLGGNHANNQSKVQERKTTKVVPTSDFISGAEGRSYFYSDNENSRGGRGGGRGGRGRGGERGRGGDRGRGSDRGGRGEYRGGGRGGRGEYRGGGRGGRGGRGGTRDNNRENNQADYKKANFSLKENDYPSLGGKK